MTRRHPARWPLRMSEQRFRAAFSELVGRGFLTWIRGEGDDAEYLPAWEPLPDGDYSEDVRERHEKNARRIGAKWPGDA